ncbi:TPA: hypothetical protein KZI24_001098 [Listeria monocytogenes]|nr:hypothetical protein [Listeria monocytogenes]HBI2266728.1 hypothetical protein [Listeria monocytogenes]
MTEYALYKGDDLLKIGTLDELAEFRKVKRETIFFYATPTYQKRTTDKGLRVIRVD